MKDAINRNQITLAAIGAIVGWFAVFTQFIIMLKTTEMPIISAVVKFFSFFTISTNLIVALYFSSLLMPSNNKLKRFFQSPGKLTAIAGYILVVGIVYQIALRHVWQPEGLQIVANEMLHTFIPAFTFSFWLMFEDKSQLRFVQIGAWLLYPLAYTIYSFVRGHFTGLYPYPFVDVTTLGYREVLLNSLFVYVLFIVLFSLFIGGSKLAKRSSKNSVKGS